MDEHYGKKLLVTMATCVVVSLVLSILVMGLVSTSSDEPIPSELLSILALVIAIPVNIAGLLLFDKWVE